MSSDAILFRDRRGALEPRPVGGELSIMPQTRLNGTCHSATKPAASNVLQQQARFDDFITRYKHGPAPPGARDEGPGRPLRPLTPRVSRPPGADLSLSRSDDPGDHEFEMSQGLSALRELADKAARCGRGVAFTEDLGSASHAAAIVRKRGVPARVRVAS